jgi:hypothetical protein
MAFLGKRNMHLVRIQAEILTAGGALIGIPAVGGQYCSLPENKRAARSND